MTLERGFAARWLRLFPFPLKIHFKGRQLPAERRFLKIFFASVMRESEFWQPAGQKFFSFHSLQHRVLKFTKRGGQFSLCFLLRTKIKNAKRWGKKISLSLTTTIRTGQNGRERSRATKKAANLFQTYCFRWPRRWRLVFSFENSFHIGMINGELLRYVFKRKRLLLEYIPQNMQSLYLSQCSIYIVFQQ